MDHGAPTAGRNFLAQQHQQHQQQAVGSHRPVRKAYYGRPLGLLVSSSAGRASAVATVVDGTLALVPPKCLLPPLWRWMDLFITHTKIKKEKQH